MNPPSGFISLINEQYLQYFAFFFHNIFPLA